MKISATQSVSCELLAEMHLKDGTLSLKQTLQTAKGNFQRIIICQMYIVWSPVIMMRKYFNGSMVVKYIISG